MQGFLDNLCLFTEGFQNALGKHLGGTRWTIRLLGMVQLGQEGII